MSGSNRFAFDTRTVLRIDRHTIQSDDLQRLRDTIESQLKIEQTVCGSVRNPPEFSSGGPHLNNGRNFSRINRDIRFAKDKTPYRAQMYLKLGVPFPGGAESGQLYVGLTKDAVTAGFRIYAGSKFKESALALIAAGRVAGEPSWLARQKKRLGQRCESYWYSAEKGNWTQREGWPTPDGWPKVRGWIVRRKLKPADAGRASFPGDVAKIFKDLCPLLRFTSLHD